MGLINDYLQNMRKPTGLLGKVAVVSMNIGHIPVSWYGLLHLKFHGQQNILDIGCGGGANIRRMLALTQSNTHVDGVDHSPECVEMSTRKNRREIERGRCSISLGDVSALDIPDESYDIATAFETVYFWPDLDKAFSEVYRILKPGGVFLVCNETDGTGKQEEKFAKIIEGMTNHTADEVKQVMEAAGFKDIQINVNPAHKIAVRGYKK